MLITIGECKIEVDEKATREFYSEHFYPNDCSCSGCRNFREAVSTLPAPVHEFFSSCGVDDLRLITEIIPYVMKDGLMLYGGFFHVVGRMSGAAARSELVSTSRPSASKLGRLLGIQKRGHETLSWSESATHELSPGFSVWFKDGIDLRQPGFPENALQIEIQCELPWVIGEPCDYRI